MLNLFVILLILVLLFIYFYNYTYTEHFQDECWIYNDNYNDCYSNSNCTIGFLPDGSTHCMKKFLNEDI
jgi:hypothetical protein